MQELKTLPAGRYFVGDPCYVVADNKWMDFLEGGNFAGKDMIEFDGGFAGCVDTAYGDGVYLSNIGGADVEFPVDAGLLGAVSANLICEKYGDIVEEGLGAMVDFPKPFTVRREGTVVVIGHIRIETGFADSDDDRMYENT